MMDVTNVHFRFFARMLTRYTTLWTEMLHSKMLIHNESARNYTLTFNPIEHPVICQLGGNTASELAQAAKYVEEAGFDEVNINCGCPSSRVAKGAFGVVLMKNPDLVADCIAAMNDSVSIPAHVKCRIGVDDQEDYEFTRSFVEKIAAKGSKQFQVHARKAYLKGLNPAQNRSVPPLNYDTVVKLAHDFPDTRFTINGGFRTLEDIEDILKDDNKLIGCMIGRMAYLDPWRMNDIDRRFYGMENPGYSRRELLKMWGKYCDVALEERPHQKWPNFIKPIVYLFKDEKYCAFYRRLISDTDYQVGMSKFSELMDFVIAEFEQKNPEALDQRPPSGKDYVREDKTAQGKEGEEEGKELGQGNEGEEVNMGESGSN